MVRFAIGIFAHKLVDCISVDLVQTETLLLVGDQFLVSRSAQHLLFTHMWRTHLRMDSGWALLLPWLWQAIVMLHDRRLGLEVIDETCLIDSLPNVAVASGVRMIDPSIGHIPVLEVQCPVLGVVRY